MIVADVLQNYRKEALKNLGFDRIQTCASQILVERCYYLTKNPHVRGI